MPFDNSPHEIFLSYVQNDESYAEIFRGMIEPLGFRISTYQEIAKGNNVENDVESALTHCSILVVLLGPKTPLSRWVDLEIELAIEPRIGMPGAGLLGLILPEHEDFHKPYYEPESIPIRLHDRVRWEYALVRKWSENQGVVQQWLQDAERRRRQFRSSPNYSVHQALEKFQWDDSADTPRPFLQVLRERQQ